MKDHELLPMSQVLSYILDSAEPLVKVRIRHNLWHRKECITPCFGISESFDSYVRSSVIN